MNSIWFPYTQMATAKVPIQIVKAEGVWLYTDNGKAILDGISSWWTCIHGHRHPAIMDAIKKQTEQLDHVLLAGFTHPGAEKLADQLLECAGLIQGKVFYSDNGSTAVEVGVKMAIQYQINIGKPERKTIIVLKGGFHGETFGSMALAGEDSFFSPFKEYLFKVQELDIFHENFLEQANQLFTNDDIAAFVYEPLLMGTAGMLIYHPQQLDPILSLAKANGAVCVADEVFTGFGRTGKMWASDYCKQKPDILCLAKGLTGGAMTLGATICIQSIFESFNGPNMKNALLHGHSYTANPIACSAALANLELFSQDQVHLQINHISNRFAVFHEHLNQQYSDLGLARHIGVMLAFELKSPSQSGYFNPWRDRIYSFFIEKNILLRPLGNVLYFLPPYCIEDAEIDEVFETILAFLETIRANNSLAH